MPGCDEGANLTHLIEHSYDGIEKCFERIEFLEKMFNEMAKEVTRMTETFGRLHELAENAEKAQMIFAQKVHDLKYIDKKRDDVINDLCQKVERTNSRIDALASLLGIKVDN